MASSLLGKVGKHGGKHLPAGRLTIWMANSWKLGNGFQEVGVSVSRMSLRKQELPILLFDYGLNQFSVCWISSSTRPDQLHLNRRKCCKSFLQYFNFSLTCNP